MHLMQEGYTLRAIDLLVELSPMGNGVSQALGLSALIPKLISITSDGCSIHSSLLDVKNGIKQFRTAPVALARLV
jgi:hypothetical protein